MAVRNSTTVRHADNTEFKKLGVGLCVGLWWLTSAPNFVKISHLIYKFKIRRTCARAVWRCYMPVVRRSAYKTQGSCRCAALSAGMSQPVWLHEQHGGEFKQYSVCEVPNLGLRSDTMEGCEIHLTNEVRNMSVIWKERKKKADTIQLFLKTISGLLTKCLIDRLYGHP